MEDQLLDDLVEEILLRFPPDDPGSLLNAALVSKTWCRIVSGAGFNRRFREFHHRRPPPVLGFFCGICKPSDPYSDQGETGFMPLAPSFRRLPRAFSPSWHPVDARHGRVLFYDKHDVVVVKVNPKSVRLHFIVWDPIVTGEVWRLPLVPMSMPMDRRLTLRDEWSAALICGHHVDSAFRVVVVATDEGLTSACVYSLEQQAWGVPISAQLNPFVGLMRGRNALIGGNVLYFRCERSMILEYDMSKQGLSLISQPPESQRKCIALMTAEDGGLGFAVVLKSELCTWSRDGDGRWAQQRVYSLDKLLPSSQLSHRRASAKVSAAENACSVVFIRTFIGIFIIDLKFGRVRKIYEFSDDRYILAIVPYASFCTPGTCLIPHETKCN